MYGRTKISRIRTAILLCLVLFSVNLISAQSDPAWEVKWLGQFPAHEAKSKKSFGDRISEVVFGKKPMELIKPFSVLAEDPGHYQIIDQGSGRIVGNAEGKMLEIKEMKKASQPFPSLVGIAGLPGEEILFTDSRLNQVYKITDGNLSLLSDALSLDQPTGIAFCENTGEIWVVETGAHKITVLDREGTILKTVGKRGSSEGFFNYPTFIWIDPLGKVYIVDSMNFRIQVFDQQGNFLFAFGESGDATGYMARPKGVASDSRGNIYVADALFHVVQIFDSSGNFLYSFGNQGQEAGEFWMPAGIYIDTQDFIYVADSYNARIQVFELVKRP